MLQKKVFEAMTTINGLSGWWTATTKAQRLHEVYFVLLYVFVPSWFKFKMAQYP
jgi:hypothetical protein